VRKLAAPLALALALATAGSAQAADTRYSIAGGCFDVPGADGGPFRLQATTLAEYLLYSKDERFLAADMTLADAPSEQTEWEAVNQAGKVRLTPMAGGEPVVLGAKAEGCAAYPEIEVNATGAPVTSRPFENVSGLVDAHMHMMAFEFLGGMAHCGRPWHKYGVTHALVDCADHTATNGCGAVLENVLYGNPARCHDSGGWPTFTGWPHPESLTHENSYYKWLERAWRGGLRIFTNLLVENKALCDLYPLKRNGCNEMDSVRLQYRDINALQDYIDAQSGGPGKGWFRIVDDPYEARRVINAGKLAVILGIEISQLFDCNVYNGTPTCSKEDIDRQLEEVDRMGVRQMELVNKFDNGLAGVAGDGGSTGVVVNNGNKKETNRYWDMRTCNIGDGDKEQPALPRDVLIGNGLAALLPPGTAPVYPEPPHCNFFGLTDLGEYVVRQMMKRQIIIDPDHLSQSARDETLALVEAARYHGIMSSHSWSNDQDYPRILARGGIVTPYAGSSTGFVEQWKKVRRNFDRRFFMGFGYGADMNGFGSQGGPRGADVPNPVKYPFKSFDGSVTLDKQRSGERVYDINADGVAHYGLYPDWIEDLRMLAGDQIIEEMGRGAEAYLEMWERTVGIRPAHRCPAGGGDFGARTLKRMRLGMTPFDLLRKVRRQPLSRGRVWRYCVREPRTYEIARNFAVFTPKARLAMIATTARSHRAALVGVRDRVERLQGARRVARGVRTWNAGHGNRFVFGVRGNRVRYVALAGRRIASRRATLLRYLRLAGLR
jgi:hypothetical protein